MRAMRTTPSENSAGKTAAMALSSCSRRVRYSVSTSQTVSPGEQSFTWDGKNNSGAPQPDGKYTISVSLRDTNGQTVALSTEHSGVVESVDMTKTPPTLSVDGQTYTLDQIRQVRRAGN